MMKKIMLSILFMVLVQSVLHSAVATGYPLYGAFGVDLASDKYVKRASSVEWVEDGYGNWSDTTVYGRPQTIALGGIKAAEDKTMTVTIDCPNGFYFVNNSNSAYKRPFSLQVVKIEGLGFNPCYTLSEGLNSISLTYDKYPQNSDLHFDLILVLEGNISDSGELKLNGRSYPMAEGEYSALVNIVVSAPEISEYTITVPFSGYYSRGSVPSNIDTSSSLYVWPTAYASNLSIDSMAGTWKPLADVYFNYNFGISDGDGEDENHTEKIRLFFSSSRFPEVNNGKFKLIHTSELDSINPSNSGQIGYTIRFEDEFGNQADFTGEMTSSDLNNASSNQYISVQKGSQPPDGTLFKTPNYYYTSGVAYIRIDPIGTKILKPGMYESDVYIHVVSNI